MPEVRSNGATLYYEIHGTGQPLLLIHGLGSSTRDWEYQVPEFSKSYQVITFDLRGHGRSDKPPGPYGIPMFAADAAGLLEALKIGPAHVIGLSLGGAVAFQMAIDTPHRVRTLTVANSTPEYVVRSLKDRIMLWQRLLISRWLGMRILGEVLTRRLFVKPEHAQLRRKFVARWVQNDKRAYLDTLRAMIGWSVVPKLDSIKAPTLIVASEHDYSTVSQQEIHVARIPGAQLVVIPDSRHALPAEKPDEFNRVVLEFLARHP